MAGATLSQGQVQISWQAQHFRKDFAAGAALSQGQRQSSWQAQHFVKIRSFSSSIYLLTYETIYIVKLSICLSLDRSTYLSIPLSLPFNLVYLPIWSFEFDSLYLIISLSICRSTPNKSNLTLPYLNLYVSVFLSI